MYNKTVFKGYLGTEPELKYLPDGKEVCSFRVCNSNKRKDGTEDKIWFSVSTFGYVALSCSQYLHKGSAVFIEGRLKADLMGNPPTFTKRDGSTGSAFNLTAYEVEFLDMRADVADDAESEEVAW